MDRNCENKKEASLKSSIKQESRLRFVPVIAAVIAAISATASGISSYYAYRGQTSSYRSAIFMAQFEAASALASDMFALIRASNDLFDEFDIAWPSLEAWLSHHSGNLRLNDNQYTDLRDKIQYELREINKITSRLDTSNHNLAKSYIRFAFLFPPQIQKPFDESFDALNINAGTEKWAKFGEDMREAAVNRDLPKMKKLRPQLSEIKKDFADSHTRLKNFSEKVGTLFSAVSEYLAIDIIEQDLRGSRPASDIMEKLKKSAP